MAKKQKQPTHTYDELLKMAVAKCQETGGMPSRRSWTHDGFLDFEELKQVLGKGDWNRAEKVIREAYLGVNVQPDKAETKAKGGKKMTNDKLMEYQASHTSDELLALAVQECAKHGKMLSDSKWMTTTALDFEEIVMVLGEGSWDLARRKIDRAWRQHELEQDRVQKESANEGRLYGGVLNQNEFDAMLDAMAANEGTDDAFAKARNGRRLWTYDDCLDFLCKKYQELGRILKQIEINELSAAKEGPSYPQITKHLGPKRGWEKLVKDKLAKEE